jgi:type I restriction enzyme S subunit
MTMHGGLVDQANKFKKRVASADTSGYKIVTRDQLVVGFPIDEGVLSVQDLYDAAIVSPAYDVWDIHRDKVLPPYLERFLRSAHALSYYRQMLRGTTARRRTLPDELFLAIRVPVPPIPEQRRIADILDKVDAIRRKRKEAIALTEDLLRSAFLDMFGDPVTNPKGWELKPLAKLGRITTGNTPSRAVDEYFGDDIEWIKSDNINTPSHYLTRATEGLSAQGRAVGRTVPAGSSLMTCIAGSADCIGNVALTDRVVAFNQQINAITPYEGVDHRFLYVLLLVGKRLVQAASTNSMKGMVSKGKLEAVQVPSPPPKAQSRFGESFERVLKLSHRQEIAQQESELLFEATVQRAFSGQLANAGASC